jgi:hypothetical protein
MTHGTRSGYNGGCRCPSCTEANTEASWARRNRLASHAPSGPPSPRRQRGPEATHFPTSEISEAATSRSVSGGGVNLFDVLSAAAETFLANHPAAVAARTAAGAHAPMALPSATGIHSRTRDQLAPRTVAISALPQLAPQVSRFIPPGCPAFRLLVGCGCPFGWDTPDMPDVVVCPKHGNTRVASASSSETWSGGPLPLAIPAEPEPPRLSTSCSSQDRAGNFTPHVLT